MTQADSDRALARSIINQRKAYLEAERKLQTPKEAADGK